MKVTMSNTHLPLAYNVSRPEHKSKLEERQYVKERLALAYRVLAHERLCKQPFHLKLYHKPHEQVKAPRDI
jgi:hypothetical protein